MDELEVRPVKDLSVCSRKPKYVKSNPLSVKQFNKYFTLIKLIGQGDYGNVYECVDNINKRVCAMKIVASKDSDVINTFYDEFNTVCQVWNTFHQHLDVLHPVYYRGEIDPKILDIPELKLDLVISWGGRYGDVETVNEDEDGNPLESVVLFITMPLIFDPKKDNISLEDSFDIYFEMLVSILYLKSKNWEHGDLNYGNVILRHVDYTRVYTVETTNGITEYIVKSKHQPVIIDWGSHRFNDDLKVFTNEFTITVDGQFQEGLPDHLAKIIKTLQYSPKILELDDFIPLTKREIVLGDKVKYLKVISLI